MIKVSLIKKNGNVLGLECSGHANTDEYGKDLLCASVSAILTGGFNTFSDNQINEIKLEEGYAYLIINDDNDAKVILNTIITQLKTIEQVYPKNIEIK